ncbi:MAG: hypothetical protein JSR48_07445 [Verrucomicrobia bacterium]|nr:hypothetical protein [Verrucomicrobiota bacterium]
MSTSRHAKESKLGRPGDARSAYRARIYRGLIDVCRQLELSQAAAGPRRACREVQARLRGLAREENRTAKIGS